ncbi:MAG: transporter substrate-binding domain-containing protein [Peptostreptococcaceae bacterium]|nr:transporter substrate-binding domain-containing protein [Peptostreptococcaceae bacterium]
MNTKKLLALLMVGIMIFAVVACSPAAEPSAEEPVAEEPVAEMTKLDEIKEAGKLVLGTSADYPPYEFHVVKDGADAIVGFDIEIAKAIAEDLGVELEIKDMAFNGLLPALEAGGVDLVIAGLTPTEERALAIDFSEVYYTAIQGVMLNVENADSITTVEDLNGKIVGVQKGTTQEEIAKTIEGAEVKGLGKMPDLVLQLKNGNIDAVVAEKPVATAYANNNDDIMLADMTLDSGDSGSAIGFKKGAPEFVEAVNASLTKLMDADMISQYVFDAIELSEEN